MCVLRFASVRMAAGVLCDFRSTLPPGGLRPKVAYDSRGNVQNSGKVLSPLVSTRRADSSPSFSASAGFFPVSRTLPLGITRGKVQDPRKGHFP